MQQPGNLTKLSLTINMKMAFGMTVFFPTAEYPVKTMH